MLIYLIAGCTLILGLTWLFKVLSQMGESTYHRIIKWGGIICLLVIAIFLFRVGQPIIAAIVGGAGVFLPYVMRLLRLYGMVRWVYGFFRKESAQAKQKHSSHTPAAATMTRAQASEILGVNENASAKEIKARYQHLMKQVHPDKGGSVHFAAQLNEAKDVLLENLD